MGSNYETIKSADLTFNSTTGQVFKNKELLELPDLSFRTLLALVQAAPAVLTVDELIEQVWQDVSVSNETVTQRIALLRKVLSGIDSQKTNYIQSIRNKGYRWVPAVVYKYAGKKKFNAYLIFEVVAISFLIYAVFTQLKGFIDKPKEAPAIEQYLGSHAKAEDFTQQAWYYLEKHEARSTALAVDLFRKSLAIDAEQLRALTGLSFALSHQVTKFNQDSELLIEAKQVAEQATAIDAEFAQGWAALGFVYDAMGELDQAVSNYEKALAIHPKDESTTSSLAYLYALQGRLVDALRLNINALGSRQLYLHLQIAQVLGLLGFDAVAEQWFTKADDLSPDNVFATHMRARFYLSKNQYQKANKVVNSAIERGVKRPELPVIQGILAWIENGATDMQDATTLFTQAVSIDGGDIEAQIWLFLSQHSSDTYVQTKQLFIDQWFAPPYSWPAAWINQAVFYGHFGDHQLALESLEKAYQSGYRNHRWLIQLPPLKPLQDRPEWRQIIEAMQNDVSQQQQQVLKAEWLPTSFLDPQN